MKTIYTDLHNAWLENIKPMVIEQYGEDDRPALHESWLNYVDGEFQDRDAPDLIQHHCPSHDDPIPDDAGEFILEQMGVRFTVQQVSERPDGVDGWTAGSSHWLVVVGRQGDEMQFYYSMGPAHSMSPDPTEALWSALQDTGAIDPPDLADGTDLAVIVDPGSDFTRAFDFWCDDAGTDQDIEALRRFMVCLEMRRDLDRLFTDSEQDQLREILED